MDLLYEGIEEHPLKPSTTGDLRDRTDPVIDDVEMPKTHKETLAPHPRR